MSEFRDGKQAIQFLQVCRKVEALKPAFVKEVLESLDLSKVGPIDLVYLYMYFQSGNHSKLKAQLENINHLEPKEAILIQSFIQSKKVPLDIRQKLSDLCKTSLL